MDRDQKVNKRIPGRPAGTSRDQQGPPGVGSAPHYNRAQGATDTRDTMDTKRLGHERRHLISYI